MRNLVFDVSGDSRAVPRKWWHQLAGPLPDPPYPCDGCSWSPDVWAGFAVWPACVIHDYHYATGVLGTTWQGRRKADLALRRNIATLVRLQGGGRLRARSLAWLYWGRVRLWGGGAYAVHAGPHKVMPWFKRWVEVWGRQSPKKQKRPAPGRLRGRSR